MDYAQPDLLRKLLLRKLHFRWTPLSQKPVENGSSVNEAGGVVIDRSYYGVVNGRLCETSWTPSSVFARVCEALSSSLVLLAILPVDMPIASDGCCSSVDVDVT